MSSLYKLTNEYLSVMAMAEAEDETEYQCLLDALESIEAELEGKADAYATIITELKADEDKLSKEIERLSERKEKIKKNITILKNNLYKSMKVTGKEKFKTLLFNFTVKKTPPAVHVINEQEALSSDYIRIKKEIDKVAIKEALKKGEILEFAELRQSEGVQIR